MKELGKYLFIFGAGSIALNFMGANFKLLMWIDMWGETIGMAIRVSATLLGTALFLIGIKLKGSENEEKFEENLEAIE